MKANPEISIIIPVYNVEEYIVECLDSVMSQEISRPMEIIIIDDCGTDRSMELVEEYSSRNKDTSKDIIIIHNEKNSGLSASRNIGIGAASGRFIYFLDSDDCLFDSGSLNALYRRMAETDADFVSGEHCKWYDDGTISPTKFYSPDEEHILGNERVMSTYLKRWTMIACNKLIKREFITDNDLYFLEGTYFEDNYWAFMVALKATHIEVIPEITYKYRQRKGSITWTFKKKHYDDSISLIKTMHQKIVSENLLERYDRSLLTALYEHNRFGLTNRALSGTNLHDARAFFRTVQRYCLTSLSEILHSDAFSPKDKKHTAAFYLGDLGFHLRYFKFLSRNKNLTLQ